MRLQGPLAAFARKAEIATAASFPGIDSFKEKNNRRQFTRHYDCMRSILSAVHYPLLYQSFCLHTFIILVVSLKLLCIAMRNDRVSV